MQKRTAPLTEMDRRVASQLEALYGPLPSKAPPALAPAPVTRRRRSGAPVLRTALLAMLSVSLVLWTEPGRAMYGAITDGARTGYEALVSGDLSR